MIGLTDDQRALAMLDTRPRAGLTQADVAGPTADGGPPIRDLDEVVRGLRERGYLIHHVDTRDGRPVYCLNGKVHLYQGRAA